MIALKVRKVGNSLGIVLPKETLKRLNIVEGETLYLTESFENGYRMTPYNENFSKQIAIAEEIMRQDRDLLKELAKR